MDHLKLRGIEESTGVQAVHGDEVSPLLASISEIKARGGRAKRAVGRGHAAMGCRDTLAGSRSGFDHQARFISIFGRRRARNHLERLDRIEWYLVGENLALLVSDRLAIQRKRIFCMITEAVKKAVRIRH